MQIRTKPHDAKKLIDASMPKNISAVDRAVLEAQWADKAAVRAAAIELANRTPTDSNKTIKVELRRYGRQWQVYVFEGAKRRSLLPSPSLFSSAMEQMDNYLEDEAFK